MANRKKEKKRFLNINNSFIANNENNAIHVYDVVAHAQKITKNTTEPSKNKSTLFGIGKENVAETKTNVHI